MRSAPIPFAARESCPALASNGFAEARHIQELYDADYANVYEQLYLAPWLRKHQLNVALIASLLHGNAAAPARWLDLCCGQAWHFSRFSGHVRMTGVDISAHQLARAAQRNPHARFMQADVRNLVFAPGSFDLVTCFWGAYCYLDDDDAIMRMLERAASWTAPGGALYFEVLLPRELATFNESEYAQQHHFHVHPLSPDFHRWSYRDSAGMHTMSSPSLDRFIETVSPAFGEIETRHDGGFMTHLVARQRHGQIPADGVAPHTGNPVAQPKEDSS